MFNKITSIRLHSDQQVLPFNISPILWKGGPSPLDRIPKNQINNVKDLWEAEEGHCFALSFLFSINKFHEAKTLVGIQSAYTTQTEETKKFLQREYELLFEVKEAVHILKGNTEKTTFPKCFILTIEGNIQIRTKKGIELHPFNHAIGFTMTDEAQQYLILDTLNPDQMLEQREVFSLAKTEVKQVIQSYCRLLKNPTFKVLTYESATQRALQQRSINNY